MPDGVIGNAWVKINPLTAGFAAETSAGLTGIKGLLSGLGVPKQLLSGFALTSVAVGYATAKIVGMGSAMQQAEVQIANSSGSTIKAADAIGNAFLATAGKSTFTATTMATSYAKIAGQLETTQGKILTTAQAASVMHAADILATASATDLATATSALGSTMQAFQIPAKGASDASNILFNTSNKTSTGLGEVASSLDRVRSRLGAVSPPLGQLSGLLVDMTAHGETGRIAMSALNSIFTALEKPILATVTAQKNLKTATANLLPSLDTLAQRYRAGTVSQAELTATTKTMSVAQLNSWKNYLAATASMDKATAAQRAYGVSLVDAHGKMLPLDNIIGQLHTSIDGLTKIQALAELHTLGFGSQAAQLYAVIKAGTPALDKATASVTKLNAVQLAAELQNKTLKATWDTVKAAVVDAATGLGVSLIPAVQSVTKDIGTLVPVITGVLVPAFKAVADVLGPVIGAVVKVISVLLGFKSLAEAIAAVIGGLLIARFALMASEFASAILGMIGSMALGKINMVGFAATVETEDAVIEAANLAASRSFTAMLGPIGVALALVITFRKTITDAVNAVSHSLFGTDTAATFQAKYDAAVKGVTNGSQLDAINKQYGEVAKTFGWTLNKETNKKLQETIMKGLGPDTGPAGKIVGVKGGAGGQFQDVWNSGLKPKGSQLAVASGVSASAASKLNAAELAMQAKGIADLNVEVSTIHSKSLNALNVQLNGAHTAALERLVVKLDATHNTKLLALATKLEADYVAMEKAKNAILIADAKTGTSALSAQLALAQSTSLASLNTGLDAIHTVAFDKLIAQLDATHNKNLVSLASQLVAAHKAVLADWVAQSIAAQAASYLAQATGAARISGLQETVREDQATMIGLTGQALQTAKDKLAIDQEALAKAQEDAVLQAAIDNAVGATAKATAQAALALYDAGQITLAQTLANNQSWNTTMQTFSSTVASTLAAYQAAVATANPALIATALAAWRAAVMATITPGAASPTTLPTKPPTSGPITISAPVTVHATTNATAESLASQVSDAVAANNEQLVVLLTGRAGY